MFAAIPNRVTAPGVTQATHVGYAFIISLELQGIRIADLSTRLALRIIAHGQSLGILVDIVDIVT